MDLTIKKGTNRFYIGSDENNSIAEITYYYDSESVIVIDHTYVSEELRGQSIAGKLLHEVVQLARTSNLKVIPVCSYAVLKLTRNDEYKDILYVQK
ncbi:MAG: N-acetyltransferase [Bacilli bacterium]|nr:N-acetyltransferase [Bacilli bacterium]